jgi:hypothetical protein
VNYILNIDGNSILRETKKGSRRKKYRTKGEFLMTTIDQVWNNIKTNQNEVFHQIRGQSFSYIVQGNAVRPSATNRSISKGDFEKAISRLPLRNTVTIQDLQGPSYVFALLNDERIVGKKTKESSKSREAVGAGLTTSQSFRSTTKKLGKNRKLS